MQNEKIKEYRAALKGSRENYSERLEELEHRLISADISKAEEKSLNDEIMLLKRKLREAESSGNIEMKLEQCEERKEVLDEEITKVKALKDPIELEFTRIKTELDKKNENITGLKTVSAALPSNSTQRRPKRPRRRRGTTRSTRPGRRTRRRDWTSWRPTSSRSGRTTRRSGRSTTRSRTTSGSRNN